jgi:flavodoxin
MKVLVAYMSKTGNTKKVAEAIFGEIREEKEIKRIDEVDSLEGYDLAFLGFPIHAEGPDKQVKAFLERQTKGHTIALFITHAAPEDAEELPTFLEKFRDAAAGADLVGMFDCQGQLAAMVKFIMKIHPNAKFRAWAKQDNSQGQPDAARLERARAFAREIMARTS